MSQFPKSTCRYTHNVGDSSLLRVYSVLYLGAIQPPSSSTGSSTTRFFFTSTFSIKNNKRPLLDFALDKRKIYDPQTQFVTHVNGHSGLHRVSEHSRQNYSAYCLPCRILHIIQVANTKLWREVPC